MANLVIFISAHICLCAFFQLSLPIKEGVTRHLLRYRSVCLSLSITFHNKCFFSSTPKSLVTHSVACLLCAESVSKRKMRHHIDSVHVLESCGEDSSAKKGAYDLYGCSHFRICFASSEPLVVATSSPSVVSSKGPTRRRQRVKHDDATAEAILFALAPPPSSPLKSKQLFSKLR